MSFSLNSKPTEAELRDRIQRQLEWRGGSKEVALIWQGYLAALLEWGGIELSVYDRLCELLPDEGRAELYELFVGEKNTEEKNRDIELQRMARVTIDDGTK